MEPETTCTSNDTTEKRKFYMAMELSQKEWKLGFSVGPGQAPRLRSVPGRDLGGLVVEIQLARERFGLGKEVEVKSCYEAGRDGFWLHRFLEKQGVRKLVVDSASIEVSEQTYYCWCPNNPGKVFDAVVDFLQIVSASEYHRTV